MEALRAKIADRVAQADADYAAWERKQGRRSRPGRRSRQAFIRSPAWRAARAECLARMGTTCSQCGSTERIQVDHILPRSRFPALALDQGNLRPLCWVCNRTKAARVLNIDIEV